LTIDEASLFSRIQIPFTIEAIRSSAEKWVDLTSTSLQLIKMASDLLSSSLRFAHFYEAFSKRDLQKAVEQLRKTAA
jgi:diacylglycerol kinase